MAKKQHALYVTWNGMKQRCANSNRADYKYYGAKGITVCQRWLIFENFIFDVGERPSINHTLDRIDANKGYEPCNVRWASKKTQALNTSHALVEKGKSLSDRAREAKISISHAHKLNKQGKPLKLRGNSKYYTYNGIENTLKDWAKELGISSVALSKRIDKWGLEKALTTKKYASRIGNKNSKTT